MSDGIFAEMYVTPQSENVLRTEEVLIGQHVGLLEDYHIVVGNVFLRFSRESLKHLVKEISEYLQDVDETDDHLDHPFSF